MIPLPRHLALLVIVFMLATAATGAPNLDAGLGDDAGETPETAAVLPGPGAYDAVLGMPSDTDWFRLDVADATDLASTVVCADLTAEGPAIGDVRLLADPHHGPAVAAPLQVDGTHLALASTFDTVWMRAATFDGDGDDHDDRGDGRRGDNGGPPYAFDLTTRTLGDLGDGDAGTGLDAGATLDDAMEAPVGSCFAGRLAYAGNDLTDWYAFDVDEGDHLTLSLALLGSLPLRLTVVDASGDTVAVLGDGDVLQTVVEEGGTWALRLSLPDVTLTTDSGSGLYVLGLEVDEKPTRPPCKPSCVS